MKSFADTVTTINTFFLNLILVFPTLVIIAFASILHFQAGMYFVSSLQIIFCAVVVLFIGLFGLSTDFVVNEVGMHILFRFCSYQNR